MVKYCINSDVYRSIFGVPTDVADKFIKLASHSALKVLLFIMRNGIDALDDNAAFKLGISKIELDEALLYWHTVGILNDSAIKSDVQPKASEKPAEKAVESISKPDRLESARRIGESPEIAQLLRQAEQAFGRTLKQAEISTLIYITDALALSPPAVLMLLQYADMQEHLTASFIEATAVRWVNAGLTSVREIEKEIQIAAERKSAWGAVRTAFGIDRRRPSKNEEKFSYQWVIEWGFKPQMLHKAYDACIDAAGKLSLPYINKILASWHENGITTPEQADCAKKSHTDKKSSGKQDEAPSFDISLFEQLMGGN